MIPTVFDNSEQKGIDLFFDLENGLGIVVFMDDQSAQEMINIMQNKLNTRG